jgi:predicted Zn-dependent protease
MQEMELATVVFMADHQLVSARQVAETAYRASPSVQTLLLLANAMQLQGRFKEVVTMLNAKRSQYSSSPAFLITLAESEYDSILYGVARDDLQHALALDPKSYQAHFLLANAWFKLDHTEDAIAEYRRAIELSPAQPRTYYQLALALEAKQDQAGAQEQLEKALSLDGHYGPALIAMGKLLIGQNRPADAVARLQVAVADNPRSEQGYFLLSKAYAQLGDQQKSQEMAKRLAMVRDANAKPN